MDYTKKELYSENTGLIGYVETSFENIIKHFGEPEDLSDSIENKIDVEWKIITPYGLGTIYNYKDGPHFLGKEGKAIEDITDWHIGGHNGETYAYINEILKN